MYRELNVLKKVLIVLLLVLIALFVMSCGKDTGENMPSSGTNNESLYVEPDDDDYYDNEGFDDPMDIGEDKIIDIALEQVEGATRDNIREAKKEIERGRYVYEFEIVYDDLEYEIEIDGGSGNVISLEIDD